VGKESRPRTPQKLGKAILEHFGDEFSVESVEVISSVELVVPGGDGGGDETSRWVPVDVGAHHVLVGAHCLQGGA
jgi:hypothetical protein